MTTDDFKGLPGHRPEVTVSNLNCAGWRGDKKPMSKTELLTAYLVERFYGDKSWEDMLPSFKRMMIEHVRWCLAQAGIQVDEEVPADGR